MAKIISIPSFIDKETYLKIIPILIDELNECEAQIGLALKENDFNQIRALTHKIKGSSSTYGANVLHEQAVIVESSIVENSLTNIDEEIDILRSKIQEFVTKVNQL